MLQLWIPEPELSNEVKQKLNELQNKGIDINELILETIVRREQEIAEEKEILAIEQEENRQNKLEFAAKLRRNTRKKPVAEQEEKKLKAKAKPERKTEIQEKEQLTTESKNKKPSSHIPVKIIKLIHKEYGTKCSMPSCTNDAEEIHHEIPFALIQNHNPYILKPLCKEHHIINHGIQLAYERMRGMAVT